MLIKLFTVLYPFLRELLIGKYSRDERFKTVKVLFILVSLISLTSNWIMGKAVYSIGKDKVEYSAKIEQLNEQIKNTSCDPSNTPNVDQTSPPIKNQTTGTTKTVSTVIDKTEKEINERLKKLP